MTSWRKNRKDLVRMKIKGVYKTITINAYINFVVPRLPVLVHKETERPIDHKAALRHLYCKEGLEAVKEYLSDVLGLIEAAKKD